MHSRAEFILRNIKIYFPQYLDNEMAYVICSWYPIFIEENSYPTESIHKYIMTADDLPTTGPMASAAKFSAALSREG